MAYNDTYGWGPWLPEDRIAHIRYTLYMQVILRLSKFAWQHPYRLLAAYVTVIGSTFAYMAVPRLVGLSVDEAMFEGGSASTLWLYGGGIVLATLLRGVFSYGQTYLGEAVSQVVAYDLRNTLYDKLQRLSFAFHDREHTGNLMSKATADVEGVRMFIQAGMVRSVHTLLLLVVTSIILLSLDWQLGLVTLVFVPIIGTFAAIVSFKMRRLWRLVQQELGLMTTVLQENLSGVRVVKAFGAEEYEKGKFQARVTRLFDVSLAAQRLQSSNSAIIQFTFYSIMGLVLWLGGHAVVADRLSTGELTQFILYVGILVQPVRMFGMMVNSFARAASAGERIFEVLDAESPVEERPNAKPLAQIRGAVVFEQVDFSYTTQPTVAGVSLTVAPGQVAALLGAPGSGKSTLMHLLSRFYDVTAGRITIDGTDIRDVTLSALREAVGIVQQDVFLFSATVAENIAYGRASATHEEVVQATKTAQLHDEIMSLADGYETVLGERGVTLSGGQRQRLAIARTLLINPPILVLDDSTSSVDAATEALIQQAMANVVQGRTTFIIAHRLSSIQHADLIVVMEDGAVVESGSPGDLLATDGYFKKIADLQRDSETTASSGPLMPASGSPGGAV